MHKVLFVGRDASTFSHLISPLQKLGHESRFIDIQTSVHTIMEEFMPSIVMVNVGLNSDDPFSIISNLKSINPSLPIVALSHQNDLRLVVKTIRVGAFEFFQFPVSEQEFLHFFERIVADIPVPISNVSAVGDNFVLPGYVGKSDESKNIACRVMKIAPLDVNVMISGETGTGKELIARSIHKLSGRASKPFIPIDCVSLPPNLIESEIFGHEQGAFTGATKTKKGLLELADGGTIFLDEITELDIYLQGKLLRVLQERQFRRVGGNALIQVDIRVVSATNRDPEEAVLQEKLRKDLYYRLNVVPLKLLPLRQRKADINFLIDFFIEKLNESNKVPVKGITRRALNALIKYDWPGNVRELQNVILQMVYLSDSEMIDVGDLPDNIQSKMLVSQAAFEMENMSFKDARDHYMKQFCQNYFDEILEKYKGNISEVAKEAEISRGTIYKIFKDFDIKNPYISSQNPSE